MRIFHWSVSIGDYKCIADGYLLAKDRKDAEDKLTKLPYHGRYEEAYLDDDDCGYNGCEINEDDIAIRWED